uniref:G-protein coupled receptors family 1 profile domain-containing protein n=1 Tax=Mesocestoides corti TaxID=53468 RepID=A0A5K3EP59_MESCO
MMFSIANCAITSPPLIIISVFKRSGSVIIFLGHLRVYLRSLTICNPYVIFLVVNL